jgi:hypothetical protein
MIALFMRLEYQVLYPNRLLTIYMTKPLKLAQCLAQGST